MASSNWSDLPIDILCLCAKRLPCIEDFVRFGAVCVSWQCAAVQLKKQRSGSVWLMLSKLENDDTTNAQGTRSCYSFSPRGFFSLPSPRLQGRRCWGTHYGWLLTVGVGGDIFLFNPLTRIEIPLPSLVGLADAAQMGTEFVANFALSSDPSDGSYTPTIMVGYGGSQQPAFACPGDDKWTTVKTPLSMDDIIFFNGHFYCITPDGKLAIFDIYPTADTPPDLTQIADLNSFSDDDYESSGTFYLVEISGDLYMINRSGHMIDNSRYNPWDFYKVTRKFYAFKFNFEKQKWRRSWNLEGHAVFLGNNASFAIAPTDHPKLRGNCIYFTDDFSEGFESDHSDMGIYDYWRGLVGSFYNIKVGPCSRISRSLFFMPQLS